VMRTSGLWPAARVALNVLIVAAGVVVLARLTAYLSVVVLPILLALLLATLLAPPADALCRRGVPSALAAIVVIIGAAALLTGIVLLIVPAVVSHLGEVGDTAKKGLDHAANWLVSGPFDLKQSDVDDAVSDALKQVQSNLGEISSGLLTGVSVVAGLATGALLTIVLVFFFVHDGRRLWSWTVQLLPSARREGVDEIGRRVWTTTSGYVRGVAAIAVIDSVLIGLALAIIGVPLVIPLAALVFLGAFVPIVGATISATVAALVALVSGGVVPAVLVVVAIIVIQQVEGNLLYPVIVGRAVSLHPLAILLVLAVGSVVAGLAGAVLSVPIGAAAWTAVKPLLPDDGPAA
jgi:putative heme transporter